MAKTPVSILQEYCAKRVIVPHYDLVVNGVGSHNPIFEYRLTVSDVVTYGKGKSKKEAKHEAAKEAISVLLPNSKEVKQLESSEADIFGSNNEEEEFFSPYRDTVKNNSIGDLATICGNKAMPEPKYVFVGEVGPPHAKTFTFECHVGMVIERASSRTKQQAKHISAIKMIERLKSVVGEFILEEDDKDGNKEEEVNKKVINVYKQFGKKIPEKFYLPISEYHLVQNTEIFDHSSYLSELASYDENTYDPHQLLTNLCESNSNIECSFSPVDCGEPATEVVSCQIDSVPCFVTLGTSPFGIEEANTEAVHKLLTFLKAFS